MRFITIGDLHGRRDWLKINPDNYDKIIFVGDYMDSFDICGFDIFTNFTELLDFKKKYPDKVVLLLGNHDLYYWYGGAQAHHCSGVKSELVFDIGDLMRINRSLFQVAYQYDNYIWTHAGIHLGWYRLFIKNKIEADDSDLADTLNRLFEYNYKPLFNVSPWRGGISKEGGMFWADKHETWDKPLPGYHQIIGHTPVDNIVTRVRKYKNKIEGAITYIDVLGSNNPKFHELIIDEVDPMFQIRELIKNLRLHSIMKLKRLIVL
jgi:hypothetical protein